MLARMQQLIARIKRFFTRVLVLARKQQRRFEARLDAMRPHPVAGVLLVCVGALIACAGLVMLVTPGPGVLGLAVGLACITMGVKAARGEYGPQRVERERARKHKRVQRQYARKRRQERAAGAGKPGSGPKRLGSGD